MTFHESREKLRKSYAAGGDAYERIRGDRKSHVAMLVITVLGTLLFELLEHYTTLSFALRIVVSLAAVALAQYLAARLFGQSPTKTD